MSRSALKFSFNCAIAFTVNLAVACSAFAQKSQTAEARYRPGSARHWIVFDFSAGGSAPLTLQNARICSAQINDHDQLSQCQEWQPDTYIDSGGLIYIEVFPESGAGTYSLVHSDTTIADEAPYIRGTPAPAAAVQAANIAGDPILTSKQTAQSVSMQLALPPTAASTNLANLPNIVGDVETQAQKRSQELEVLQVGLTTLEEQIKVSTDNPDLLKPIVEQVNGFNRTIKTLNEETAKLVLTSSAASANSRTLCSSSKNNSSCVGLEGVTLGIQAQDSTIERLNKQMQEIVSVINDLGQKAINKAAGPPGPPVVLFLGQFTGNTLVTFSLCEKKQKLPADSGGTGSGGGAAQSDGTTACTSAGQNQQNSSSPKGSTKPTSTSVVCCCTSCGQGNNPPQTTNPPQPPELRAKDVLEVHKKARGNIVGGFFASNLPVNQYGLTNNGQSSTVTFVAVVGPSTTPQFHAYAGVDIYLWARDTFPGGVSQQRFLGLKKKKWPNGYWNPALMVAYGLDAPSNFLVGANWETKWGVDFGGGLHIGQQSQLSPGIVPGVTQFSSTTTSVPTYNTFGHAGYLSVGFDLNVIKSAISLFGSSPTTK
jgi:hypothetical protein